MTHDPVPRDDDGEQAGDQFVARVTVTPEQADELLRRGEFDFGDHPNFRPNPEGTALLTLFLTQAQVDALRGEGFDIEVGANVSARARERVTEVGQGDRFEGGRTAPRGLGRKIGRRGGGGRGGRGGGRGSDRDGPDSGEERSP